MRRAIMSLRLGIRGFKRARPASLRVLLAIVLLVPSIAACLNDAGTTSTPTVVPTDTAAAMSRQHPTTTTRPSATAQPTPSPTSTPIPTPTSTPRPTPPVLTSGCTQDDVLSYPMHVSEGSEPASDFNGHISISVCGRWPKPTEREEFLLNQALHVKYSYHFIEWAPDGKRLVINVPREGEIVGTGIYLVSADGSSSRLLVDASPEYNMLAGFHADLSPDGSILVYSTCKPKLMEIDLERRDYDIASLRLEGGAPVPLTDTPEFDNYPVFSPDGSRITFQISTKELFYPWERDARLVTMVADGGDPRILTPHLVGSYDTLPMPSTWSPDGGRLASVRRPYYNLDLLYTVSEDGSNLHGVTAVTSGASWAPDGDRIAFGKRVPQSRFITASTLCIAELDDIGYPRLVQVTPSDAFEGPVQITHVSWSPDGKEILFIVSDELSVMRSDRPVTASIYLVRPDGTGLRRLLEDERAYTVAAWSPDSSQIAVRVDPQLGEETLPSGQIRWRAHISPIFELLIVDRDGTVQQVLGREEVIGTR